MSDFQHTSPALSPVPGKPFRWVAAGLILGIGWVCAAGGVVALGQISSPLMETLGAGATEARPRLHHDQLGVTRGLLRGGAEGAELIWAARTTGGASGFFHAAAVHCERNGRGDATRLFLALQALERGDRKACNQWAASTPYARLMDRDMQPADFAGATWLTQKPWTELMHTALAAPGPDAP